MASWQGWAEALLRALRAPITEANMNGLMEWQRREGGTAAFNPLNTTHRIPGATSYNSVGVRNYRNPQQGLRATVATLTNGRYSDIVQSLREGKGVGWQKSLETWGTGTWSPGAGEGNRQTSLAQTQGLAGSTPAPPTYTEQDALREGLAALARGQYDPVAGLKALQRAAEATAAAVRQSGGMNIGTLSMPIVAEGGAKTSPIAKKAAAMIQHYLGTPYVWGGESPKGFDCSGLLQWVWGHLGVKIPRVTYDQWKAGRAVNRGGLRPGDAVFFRGSDSKNGLPGHVGMYIGNGMFVEAPRTGLNVRISKLSGRRDYMGARRYG